MTTERLHKGLKASFRRAAILPARYGLGSNRIRSRLLRLSMAMASWEVTPTVPVTAIVLDRHRGLTRDLRGFDVAIHGNRHVRYAGRSFEEQAADLDAARSTFVRHGIDVQGFRAPYLAADGNTLELLRERKLSFDSSSPRFLLPRDHAAFSLGIRQARSRYGRIDEGPIPSLTSSLPVELPVALPDDEILVDAMGITNASVLGRIFLEMLSVVERAGSLFALQVHPERFDVCSEAVDLLLKEATDRGAWTVSLSEIARWISSQHRGSDRWPHGRAFALAITGDLDALSLGDFAKRAVGA